MSTATAESRVKREHPPERRALLKKAGRTEAAELTEAQVTALDALPEDASTSAIEAALKGTGGAKQVRPKYPEDVRAAYEKALALTGTPESGGPKYALTIKQSDAIKRALAAKGKAVAEARAELDNVSDAQLRKIAKGQEASAEATKTVRAFLKAHTALREDRTMYARKGAAIILAYREA